MPKKCNQDCWNCELEGCPFTLRESLDLDKEIKESKTETARQRSIKRYNESPKRKIAQARYWASEKGKEANRRNTRNYLKKHREEINAKKREQYKANPEYFRQKRREQYQRQKLKLLEIQE